MSGQHARMEYTFSFQTENPEPPQGISRAAPLELGTVEFTLCRGVDFISSTSIKHVLSLPSLTCTLKAVDYDRAESGPVFTR